PLAFRQIQAEAASQCDYVSASLEESHDCRELGLRHMATFGEQYCPIPKKPACCDRVRPKLRLGKEHYVEWLPGFHEAITAVPERVLVCRSVPLHVFEGALHAEDHSGLRVGSGAEEIFVIGQEVLDFHADLVRWPEGVLDDVSHPRAVRDAHVDSE